MDTITPVIIAGSFAIGGSLLTVIATGLVTFINNNGANRRLQNQLEHGARQSREERLSLLKKEALTEASHVLHENAHAALTACLDKQQEDLATSLTASNLAMRAKIDIAVAGETHRLIMEASRIGVDRAIRISIAKRKVSDTKEKGETSPQSVTDMENALHKAYDEGMTEIRVATQRALRAIRREIGFGDDEENPDF